MFSMRCIKKMVGLLAVLGLLGWLAYAPVQAQKTKGKSRPAETKFLMKGVIQPNCAALGAALKGDGPSDDKAWDQALLHALVLNEMSYVVMDDGRCPDKEWAGAAKTLRECSGKVAEAARAKDAAAAKTAFKALTGACATCHKAHKSS
jgi:hypothetical protein